MTDSRIRTVLVTGPSVGACEALIAEDIEPGIAAAVLLEGIPGSQSRLSALQQHPDFKQLTVVRMAPGCLCCDGNMVMRVHLNRLLRTRPQRLYVGGPSEHHLSVLHQFLLRPPYDALLQLHIMPTKMK